MSKKQENSIHRKLTILLLSTILILVSAIVAVILYRAWAEDPSAALAGKQNTLKASSDEEDDNKQSSDQDEKGIVSNQERISGESLTSETSIKTESGGLEESMEKSASGPSSQTLPEDSSGGKAIKADCADFYSEALAIFDREANRFIFLCNGEERLVPASLIKIMTVLVAIEEVDNLDALAPVDVDIYLEMIEANASMAGFVGKEQVSFRDLIYGTMLPSGGEAAASLALHVAGSREAFVALMNQKAAELKLKNTSFANESGLDVPNNYSSAKDMALLLDYALDQPSFREVFTAPVYTSTSTLDHPEGVTMYSTVLNVIDTKRTQTGNYQIIGGKSGTEIAGQSWASLGVKEGKEYIVIALQAPLGTLDLPNNFHIEDTYSLFELIS